MRLGSFGPESGDNSMAKPQHRAIGRRAVAVLLAATTLLGACSSDDDAGTGDDAPTTTAPEQKVSTPAQVAAGLAEMQTLVDQLEAAGPDTASAAEARDAMSPVWRSIEGTVKTNEPDIYVDIEDSMSLLSSSVEGDEEKGALGLTDIRASITDYLAKHPA